MPLSEENVCRRTISKRKLMFVQFYGYYALVIIGSIIKKCQNTKNSQCKDNVACLTEYIEQECDTDGPLLPLKSVKEVSSLILMHDKLRSF